MRKNIRLFVLLAITALILSACEEGQIKLDERTLGELNAIQEIMDEQLVKFDKVIARIPSLSTGTITSLAITRDIETQAMGLVMARDGSNVSCFCDPPGISVTCDDLKKYGCAGHQVIK